MIRKVIPTDIADITAIYNYYIKNTCITFETELVTEEEMSRRMEAIHSDYPYLVMEEGGKLIGYCYAHGWKEKKAYEHTAEITIYLHPAYTNKGYGKKLLTALIDACRNHGLHVLIACITFPNAPSVRLHESFGFTQVSRFYEVGKKFGQWLDIYDFQLIL